jgi:colicin import membrane protein
MKTNYIKCSMWLAAMVCITISAKAQTVSSGKSSFNVVRHTDHDISRDAQGRQVEHVETDLDDKVYKAAFVDDKMTALYVNGEKIAETDWSKYSDAIAEIREQIKRDREQAIRNEEQAQRNEMQAKRNEEQAQRNELQVKKNEEQAQRNELQVKKNEEQAQRNEEQAKRNQEQVARNEEQARRNEQQAKRNEEQAAENERFIKSLTEELVNDKIIPDTNSLHTFTFNNDEMTINGVKQPDNVFKRYKEKYNWHHGRSMSYSRDGIINNN